MASIQGSILAMICGSLFAMGLAGLGVFLVIRSQLSKKKAEQSQTWPETSGKITTATLKVHEHDDTLTYFPDVRFDYVVGGQTCQGKKITFGEQPGFSSRQKASDYLARYPVEGVVSVYYNPEKPQEAVLEQAAGKTVLSLIIGIILVLVGVCLLCPVLNGVISLIRNL